MLTKVEITTNQGTTLVLPLEDISDGYSVQEVEGLDPVKATIVASKFASIDGEEYQSSRRESRNIVLKLGLEPNYIVGSIGQLRKKLYGFLMPKSRVRMRFFTEGEPTVDIYGRVEAFEGARFTKEPDVNVSLICHQPDFYIPEPIVVNGNTTTAAIWDEIEYAGSIETGILFRLNVNRTLSEFTILHRPEDNIVRTLDFIGPLSAGDVLEISTVSGAKGVTLIRNDVRSSRLYGMPAYSDWINLFPGQNDVRVYAEGAAIPYTIEYTTKFGAI